MALKFPITTQVLTGDPVLNIKYERYINEDGTQNIDLIWEPNDEWPSVHYILKKVNNEKWNLEPESWIEIPYDEYNKKTGQYKYTETIPIEQNSENFYYCIFRPDENNKTNVLKYDVCIVADNIPPSNPTNFNVENTSKNVKISWTDSEDPDWTKTYLVRKLIIDEKTNIPNSINDGVVLAITCPKIEDNNSDQEEDLEEDPFKKKIIRAEKKLKNTYSEEPFIDSNISAFKNYYYRLFTYDIYENLSMSDTLIGELVDKYAPKEAYFFEDNLDDLVINLDKGIELKWKNPDSDDLYGVKLVRVEIPLDGIEELKDNPNKFNPKIPEEGEIIYDGLDEYFSDITAEIGKTYCYKLFPYDLSGNLNLISGSIIKKLDCDFTVLDVKITPKYFDQGEIYYRGKPVDINLNYNNFGFEIECNIGNSFGNNLFIVRSIDDFDIINNEEELLGLFIETNGEYDMFKAPKYIKYGPSNEIKKNINNTYSRIFYDFNIDEDDWNKPIEDETVYYYTAYIKMFKDNGKPVYYRQELCIVKKIDFIANSDQNEIMNKFNKYFTSYNTNWSIGPSLTNSSKYIPYFTSNSKCSTLALKQNQPDLNNDINNIKYISFNCEFYGWISAGYMTNKSYFTTDNDYVQLYNVSYRELYTELNVYNTYKYLTKCFVINNENYNDNFIPALKVDKNSKLMLDSIVLCYNSYDSALDANDRYEDGEISNGDGTYTAIRINITENSSDEEKILYVTCLSNGKINYIKHNNKVFKDDELPLFNERLAIELDNGENRIYVGGYGYSFMESKCLFNSITLQNKNIKSMKEMFKNCTKLKSMPRISINVIDCESMFEGCSELVDTTNIPRRVTNCSKMFKDCILLSNAPMIPPSARDVSSMFENCTNIREAVPFYDEIKNLSNCFKNCIRLITIPTQTVKIFNNEPDDMITDGCFENCTNLMSPPYFEVPDRWK